MFDDPRRHQIGANSPPTLTEEINGRHASLLAEIDEVVATDLPMLITSDAAAAEVSAVGKTATGLVSTLNAAHKKEKEPHLEAGRTVDAWKNALLANLNTFLADCKKLVGDWQDKKEAEERAAREAEARRLRLAAETAAEQALQTMTQPAMNRAAAIADAADVAEAAAAVTTADLARVTVGGKAVASRSAKWTYEVTNLAEVPRHLMTVDDAKVKAAIASGEREISGLRIFQQKSTNFR